MTSKTFADKVTRQSLLETNEFAHIREALEVNAEQRQRSTGRFDVWQPIRETPLSAFFAKTPGALADNRQNPNLPEIWKRAYGIHIGDYARGGGNGLKEAVAIPNTLSALKIADIIIEGAEPWSDWKQYGRLVDMDTPKVNVPKTKYTDTVGGGATDAIDIFAEAGGKPPVIGGKEEPVELDCSGTNNSYRGTIQVERNDVKDNNFLAVEQPLKNAGSMIYYLVGKKFIDTVNTDTTGSFTALKSALDDPSGTGAIHAEFESLSNVIRSKFPGSQRNRADTMFIHPADAWAAIASATGASGSYPFLSRFILGPTDSKDVINNSGLAASLGLRNVWETPQQTENTVTITKRDTAHVIGLREDLTLENYDLTVGGLYNTDLVIRFHIKQAWDQGAFKITSF